MGIGALLAGVASGPVAVSASGVAAAPAVAAPIPAIFSPAAVPVPSGALVNSFEYTFSMYGPAGNAAISGVYPGQSDPPAYRVKAGQLHSIRLGATIPDTTKISSLTVTFSEIGTDVGNSADQTLYQDVKQPLGPGQYTFAADWPGGGPQPGTQWVVYLSTESAGLSQASQVAMFIVTS